eukprot:350255-Chlamydomonas_euryale.AAC.11
MQSLPGGMFSVGVQGEGLSIGCAMLRSSSPQGANPTRLPYTCAPRYPRYLTVRCDRTRSSIGRQLPLNPTVEKHADVVYSVDSVFVGYGCRRYQEPQMDLCLGDTCKGRNACGGVAQQRQVYQDKFAA